MSSVADDVQVSRKRGAGASHASQWPSLLLPLSWPQFQHTSNDCGFRSSHLEQTHGGAFHGHWELCQFLIENGAAANRADPQTGETPLHAALCKANRPKYDSVIKVLLANGAKPNCATKPNVETGSFMRDCRTKGETPLHRAAAFGSEEAVQLLLDAGALVDAKDMNGETPLSWASWHLRPASILRKLCYGRFWIHPDNHATYDHGRGWEIMGVGKPHV